jgi:cation-transporting P-type ATPase 13A2
MQSSTHDYTEGASEDNIDQVIHGRPRERRGSQVVYGEDSDGQVFDGPGDYVVPSSVTAMHHERPLSRRGSERMSVRSRQRRRSEDYISMPSRSRRQSQETQRSRLVGDDAVDDEDGVDIATSYSGRSSRRRESRNSRSVFENVARLFRSSSESQSPAGSRRASSAGTSRQRRRTHSRPRPEASDYALDDDDEESERWGYSSQEEDSSSSDELVGEGADIVNLSSEVDYGSVPPSPTPSLPFLSSDPIFGDTRIDMDNFSRTSSPLPPPGPPSRQRIHLTDEDTTVRFLGQEIVQYRQRLWTLGSVVTFGALGLIGHWFPRVWLSWVAREKAFKNIDHGFILVEVPIFVPSIRDTR